MVTFRLFPASGFRNNVSGGVGNPGGEGTNWSSSSYAIGTTNAGRAFFHLNNQNPLNNVNRSYGFPVRCVQELTGSLLSIVLNVCILVIFIFRLFVISRECCNAY